MKNKNEGEKKKKLSTINFQKIRNKIRNYEKFNKADQVERLTT